MIHLLTIVDLLLPHPIFMPVIFIARWQEDFQVYIPISSTEQILRLYLLKYFLDSKAVTIQLRCHFATSCQRTNGHRSISWTWLNSFSLTEVSPLLRVFLNTWAQVTILFSLLLWNLIFDFLIVVPFTSCWIILCNCLFQ